MLKLLFMVIESFIVGGISLFTSTRILKDVNNLQDLIYVLVLQFSTQVFIQTYWLLGVVQRSREDEIYNRKSEIRAIRDSYRR
jgi:hypothetical protein